MRLGVKERVEKYIYKRKVEKTLKYFDSLRKIHDLIDIKLFNSIGSEDLRGECIKFNHSVERLFTALSYNDSDNKALNVFLVKEFELCSKYLMNIKKLYLGV